MFQNRRNHGQPRNQLCTVCSWKMPSHCSSWMTRSALCSAWVVLPPPAEPNRFRVTE